jgi:hypothetical protein
MLAELTPILCLFLYPIFKIVERRYFLRLAFLALSLISISFHALGAFWYDGSWDTTTDLGAFYDHVWSWRNNPLIHYGRIAYYSLGAPFHRLQELLSSVSS